MALTSSKSRPKAKSKAAHRRGLNLISQTRKTSYFARRRAALTGKVRSQLKATKENGKPAPALVKGPIRTRFGFHRVRPAGPPKKKSDQVKQRAKNRHSALNAKLSTILNSGSPLAKDAIESIAGAHYLRRAGLLKSSGGQHARCRRAIIRVMERGKDEALFITSPVMTGREVRVRVRCGT